MILVDRRGSPNNPADHPPEIVSQKLNWDRFHFFTMQSEQDSY